MGGLFGVWDWNRRQPTPVERTIGAIVILFAALVCTAVMVLAVARLMFFLMPQH